jgi:hypothetical protein
MGFTDSKSVGMRYFRFIEEESLWHINIGVTEMYFESIIKSISLTRSNENKL